MLKFRRDLRKRDCSKKFAKKMCILYSSAMGDSVVIG